MNHSSIILTTAETSLAALRPRDRRKLSGAEGSRYLFYSHDGVGLGHTCRNIAIARALTAADPGATVLIATGTDDAMQLGVPERVEILKLPSLRKVTNERYASRRLLVSEPRIHALRAELLAGTVRLFQPHVLVADKHPFGAGGELKAALGLLREQGGAAALGLRDILDDARTVRAEWEAHGLGDRIAAHYDRLLVYGQRSIFDPVTEYQLHRELAARTAFCGYVVKDRCETKAARGAGAAPAGVKRPKVLATVGGGEDGTELLARFLEASAGASWAAAAVSGPHAPAEERQRLRALARAAGASFHEFIPSLWSTMNDVDALVCMGGYNTLSEALSLALPVVCVPRVQPRREQLLRAESFARLGLLRCLHPGAMTAGELGEAIREALAGCRLELARRCKERLRLHGAANAARVLSSMARARWGRVGGSVLPEEIAGPPHPQPEACFGGFSK